MNSKSIEALYESMLESLSKILSRVMLSFQT